MRILLIGKGRMGTLIQEAAKSEGDAVLAAFHTDDICQLAAFDQPADVLLDFSSPEAIPFISSYVKKTGTPLVCGTTGYGEAAHRQIALLADYAPILCSANFSVGITIIRRILREFSAYLLNNGFEAELVEAHHNQKKDVPSGTGQTLIEEIDPHHLLKKVIGRSEGGARRPREIGIHSLRGGTEAGSHQVIFFGRDEQIKIAHSAASREVFARGALLAARKLVGRGKGIYTFEEII